MKFFFTVLVGNLVLSKGPQDFPYSKILMRLCLLVYFVTGLTGGMKDEEIGITLFAMVVDTLILLGFVYMCLRAVQQLPRFVQTITALASTGAVLQLVIWPLSNMMHVEDVQAVPPETLMIYSLLMLMILSWNLAIYTHIFRESFNIRLPAAMLVTVAFVIVNLMVKAMVFPDMVVQAN